MEQRMNALGISWVDLIERAPISRQGLADIRNGDANPRRSTRRKIERALELAVGGFEQMERGEEPTVATPQEAPVMGDREAWLRSILDRYEKIEEEAGAEAADVYLRGAVARRREEERRILPDQQESRDVS